MHYQAFNDEDAASEAKWSVWAKMVAMLSGIGIAICIIICYGTYSSQQPIDDPEEVYV